MAFIEAALALWIALVTIAHELSLFSCLPLSPPVRSERRRKEEGEEFFLYDYIRR